MKSKNIFGAAVFIISFGVYLFTLSPDVTFTDSGELAGVCASLGIAHPSGYPLFAILGFLWTLLPLPFSVIYKLNVFSAFLTSASATVFYYAILLLLSYFNFSQAPDKAKKQKAILPALTQLKQEILSFAMALMFAFSLTIWGQATSIEVYPLHLLLMMLTLLTALKASLSQNAGNRLYFLSALFLGLGFANHLTTILLVPGLLLLFFYKPEHGLIISKERFKFLLWLFVPLAIGLSLYLYLPIRSASLPEFNWGWVHRDIDKFLYHASGKQYQVWMFSNMETWGENFRRFFGSLPEQMGWLGVIPLLWGFARLFVLSKQLFWFSLLLIISCIIYSFNYSIHDIETYFLTAYVAFFIIIAIGLFDLAKRKQLLLYAAFAIPLISLGHNFKENDRSNDWLVPEYTRIITDNAEPNAIIISAQWDFWCSAFWYKQRIEGIRKDITLVEKELYRRTWYPLQFRKWYPEQAELCGNETDLFMEDLMRFEAGAPYNPQSIQSRFINLLNCFIDKNYHERPIYITTDVLTTEAEVGANYHKFPEGFLIRLTRDTSNRQINIAKLKMDKFVKSAPNSKGRLELAIRSTASQNLTYLGRYALMTGQQSEAVKAFYIALELDPTNKLAMKGLGEIGK